MSTIRMGGFTVALTLLLASSVYLNAQGIRPWAENPRYWEYEGNPVLLLGGTDDDDLFQFEDFETQLDILVACGGNVIRNTMASRDSTRPWAFAKVGRKYDLNLFNDEYWERFARLLEAAHGRGVIVQIEVWATFNYYRDNWTGFNPFNPSLNVNYTAEQSGLDSTNVSHPTRADNPFFRTPPGCDNNQVVLKWQQKFVDKMLSISLRYDNILYAMDNETSVSECWGAYWAGYVRDKARAAGRRVYTTEMWDPWDLHHQWHLRTIDHPETYDFIDISQNNWQEGQHHQDALAYVRSRIQDKPRPINNTKVYSRRGGGDNWLDPRLGVDRYWGNIWGGCAGTRFHRPTTRGHGIGLDSNARRAIRGIRRVMEQFDLFASSVADRLLRDRAENEAYCLAVAGRQWAVMFPGGGGQVLLDPRGAAEGARFEVRWFDCEYLHWKEPIVGGAIPYLPLAPPGAGRWVAVVSVIE